MSPTRRLCPSCGASNGGDAGWCGQCHARFDPPADQGAPSEAGVGPTPPHAKPTVADARRRSSPIALAILVAILAWRLFDVSATLTSSKVVPGAMDRRGFKPRVIQASSGLPARYNPCRPIHYVINPAGAPDGGVADVHKAFEMTATASGLRFVYDGPTDEVFSEDRKSYQPGRYGERWAPVLVGWSSGLSSEAPSEDGRQTLGIGGSQFVLNEDRRPVYVTGVAVFDPSNELNSGFGGQTWGQVMLHELGHLVGLDHIDSTASVMQETVSLRAATWGGGDRAGLWHLGLGSPCLTPPELP